MRKFTYKPEIRVILALAGLVFSGYITFTGYQMNIGSFYYNGLFATFLVLILLRITLKNRPIMIQLSHTAILLCLALPVVDLCYHSPVQYPVKPKRKMNVTAAEKPYSYVAARGNPERFRQWWRKYCYEWSQVCGQVHMPDPDAVLPFRLKPGSEGTFFEYPVRINHHGFRGREFKLDKQDKYRIVALGESTTMGAAIGATDQPWPEVLEHLLQTRLACARPIEVINGGVWAYTLEDNLHRFERDIQPLKPDLVISYHGYNGFQFLNETLAPVRMGPVPVFLERPSYLLARCEYLLRLLHYRYQYTKRVIPPLDMTAFQDCVLDSLYARLYRQLMALAEAGDFQLALANFNMAVNEQSPADVIEFYRGGFPDVRTSIKANRLHSYMLEQLVPDNETFSLIDSTPNLDGHEDQFIDLVHFTQEGRNQLAENIFNGIKDVVLAGAQ